ncbi:MAG: vitamin K epoxide reductase family protein [archaeon]|nr:vitamin K epoxide reductase family protein [archaeon]
MRNKTKYWIIIVLMILATLASLVLSFISLQEACSVLGGDPLGCTVVQTSEYESILLGIKNAHIGLIAFPILAILSFLELKRPNKHQKRAITIGMVLGSLLAIYFLYIQFFVLNAICKYCLVVDFAVLLSMALIIFWDEK